MSHDSYNERLRSTRSTLFSKPSKDDTAKSSVWRTAATYAAYTALAAAAFCVLGPSAASGLASYTNTHFVPDCVSTHLSVLGGSSYVPSMSTASGAVKWTIFGTAALGLACLGVDGGL